MFIMICSGSIVDLHDDITYVRPCLIVVSLKQLPRRKCIGFADLQVYMFVLHSLLFKIFNFIM